MTELVVALATAVAMLGLGLLQSSRNQKRLWEVIGRLERKVQRLQDEVEEHDSYVLSEASEESDDSSMSLPSTSTSSATSMAGDRDDSDSRGL